jgi:hypothetical protein
VAGWYQKLTESITAKEFDPGHINILQNPVSGISYSFGQLF